MACSRRQGLLKIGRKVKGKAFYEPLKLHYLGRIAED